MRATNVATCARSGRSGRKRAPTSNLIGTLQCSGPRHIAHMLTLPSGSLTKTTHRLSQLVPNFSNSGGGGPPAQSQTRSLPVRTRWPSSAQGSRYIVPGQSFQLPPPAFFRTKVFSGASHHPTQRPPRARTTRPRIVRVLQRIAGILGHDDGLLLERLCRNLPDSG